LKKIDKLLLKAFLGPFFATFAILQFVFTLQFVWKYLDDLVGKGLSVWILLKLIYYTFFTTVPLSLPLTVILASIMSIGNLSEHNEITALKASGISFLRILKPLFISAVLMVGVTFVFSNNVIPWSFLKQKTMMRDILRKKLELNIREGVFYTDIRNSSIRVAKIAENGRDVTDVVVYQQSTNGNVNVTKAKSGQMYFSDDRKYFIFELYEGNNYQEQFSRRNAKDFEELPHLKTQFEKEIIRFDMRSFQMQETDEDVFKHRAETMTIKQLTTVSDSIQKTYTSLQSQLGENLAINLKFFKNTNQADSVQAKENENKAIVDSNFLLPLDLYELIKPNKEKIALNMLGSDIRSTYYRIQNFQSRLQNRRKQILKFDIEKHKKFALAFSCLLIFMVGAPIGAIIKKGGIGLPVVISVVFFLVYHILRTFGEKSVNKEEMDLILGIWLPNLVFLPFGIFFMIQSATDSPLFSLEFYKKIFKRTRWSKKA
jgi:lipopolysaccharide export system permease protein